MLKFVIGEELKESNIAEALALDMVAYPEEYHLKLETCLGYFRKNKSIYIMLTDCGKTVGYLNFSPVVPFVFEELYSGAVTDTVITPEEIMTYAERGEYDAYFSSMVIKDAGEYMTTKFGLSAVKRTARGNQIFAAEFRPWKANITAENKLIYDTYKKGEKI